MAVSKDIVQKFIESVLKSEVLEDTFAGFYTAYEDEAKTNYSHNHGLKRMLAVSASQEPDMIIKHYVKMMSQVKSESKFDALFDMLKSFVQQNNYLGKAVCEALLTCDRLDYNNQNFWLRSFNLISEILPSLDYKGVRDILKHMLEIIYSLPDKFDRKIIPQLDALYFTVSMILDKNACLLPAYLGLDELQKRITQGPAPVWKFADLFYHFIESFRPTAQIVSIVNRSDLLPVTGCSTSQGNHSWRLDSISAKFQLKGLLPYRDKLKVPQVDQLRYLLWQPYSRETLSNILNLNLKLSTRCPELIEQIAITFVQAMEKSEFNIESIESFDASIYENYFSWLHLSSNLLFFVVFHHAALNSLVDSLCEKIRSKNLKRGREHLMWAFLQYITGGVQKITLNDFIAVIKLFEVLYPGRAPIPVPDSNNPISTHILAAASVWVHLVRKAETDGIQFMRPIPPAIQLHYDYLSNMKPNLDTAARVSFRESIYCNLNSNNKSIYPITNFVDCLSKIDPVSNPDPMKCRPLSVQLIDTMTTHSKVTLIHALSQRIILLASNKAQGKYILTPALIETYSRLLIYTDIESFGLKNFMNSIMHPQTGIWKAWNVYQVLLEMYSHRVHHVPIQYKVQMLTQLHSLSSMTYAANQTQLRFTMEATELKLLLDLTSSETINMPLSIPMPRNPTDVRNVKQLVNNDSEELNKVLVLVLARTAHILSSEYHSPGFLEDILSEIISMTPLSWSFSTLNFFPPNIKEFFRKNQPEPEDKAHLRSAVEEEYRKWKAMANENNLVAYYSQPNCPPLFICILWKLLLDNDTLGPVVYKILDNMRVRTLSTHLRTFVDYLVYEFSNSVAGPHVNDYARALSDLVWKYQIVSLDRLLLCMCLRSFDLRETQVCFFIIMLFFKISDFSSIVQNFTKLYSPEHWRDNPTCYESHLEFQARYPEKYYHDFLAENNIPSNKNQTIPSFFSNTVFRFIPVFDLLVHRALELRTLSPNSAIKIETLLDEFGIIFKFHNKPLTYLYNTLHYYDSRLDVSLKRKLTSVIVGAFDDIRASNWCLTEQINQYLKLCFEANIRNQPIDEWVPDAQYYRKLIGRLVDALQDKPVFPHIDWRFNEFLNVKSHAVYVTAIELMTLPQPPDVVASGVLDLILVGHVHLERSSIAQWMNAIGLVMTNLPSSYLNVLNSKILDYMQSPLLKNPEYTKDIFNIMNFCDNYERMKESQISYLVALTHAVWHHANVGQIYSLPIVFQRDIKPMVSTESQFLFVCCLIGPFLSRMERSRILMEVAIELYGILMKVDATCELYHLNAICDFLYHIKYMFTGDAVKNDIESCIRKFKPRLQYSLRFLTHLSVNPEQQKIQ